MNGGGALGGTGPTPESISGVERPEPKDEYISKEDIEGRGEAQFITKDQINARALLALRASLVAVLGQLDAVLLLNGVIPVRSSPRRAAPGAGEEDKRNPPMFGAKTTNTERAEAQED